MKNSQPATGLSREKIYNPQLEGEVVKKKNPLCNLTEDKFQGIKGELGVKIWGKVPVCGVGASCCWGRGYIRNKGCKGLLRGNP